MDKKDKKLRESEDMFIRDGKAADIVYSDFDSEQNFSNGGKKRNRSAKKYSKFQIILAVIVSVILTFIAVTAGLVLSFPNIIDSDDAYLRKLSLVKMILENEYLYDIDSSKMNELAVQAYVEGLDEPYTHYYTKEEFNAYTEDLEDSYVGIGVVISKNDNNQIEVVSATEDSPAYKAGILTGDILAAVEGEEFSGDQMQTAVAKIKSGKAGESVNITFIRNGEILEKTIVRENISSKSVKTQMLDNGIGYVRITSFNINDEGEDEDTYTEFKSKVEQLQAQGMTKMIIDLRDNPGGSLEVACKISDMLVGEGLITYIEYKDGERKEYKSDAAALGIPMAILINEGSASASELVTGCLKDYGAATVIGKKSFGKGIVQTIVPFPDGTGMSLTIAKYYTPNGVCIHGTGITPDIEVEIPDKWKQYYSSSVPQNEDTQLQKALEILNNK